MNSTMSFIVIFGIVTIYKLVAIYTLETSNITMLNSLDQNEVAE